MQRQRREAGPLTLGQAVAAHVRIIAWCKQCKRSIEPGVAELIQRHGESMTVIDWAKRLRCSNCGARDATFVLSSAPLQTNEEIDDVGPWGRRPFRSRNNRLIVGALVVGNVLLWAFILSWSGIPSLSGFFALSAAGGRLTGRASVIDGDTIDLAGQRIRLHGIDAPESQQTRRNGSGATYPCGTIATSALAQMIGARLVGCQPFDRDRYGRRIARCFAGDTDLNGWLVRRGYAVAYWRYSWRYALPEIMARIEGVGLWQGDFKRPENWRRNHRR